MPMPWAPSAFTGLVDSPWDNAWYLERVLWECGYLPFMVQTRHYVDRDTYNGSLIVVFAGGEERVL